MEIIANNIAVAYMILCIILVYVCSVLTGPYSLTAMYMDHYYFHGGPLKFFLFKSMQLQNGLGWVLLFVNMVHSYLNKQIKVPGLN